VFAVRQRPAPARVDVLGDSILIHPQRLGAFHACLVVLVALQSGGCALAPAGDQLPATYVLPKAVTGDLRDYAERVEAQLTGGESAFWLLDRAEFSLQSRLALFDRASVSLDIQYFIWEKDPSSWLLLRRILHAADRGVRVRLLFDDLTLAGHEEEFAALGKHPNISVRSFNPFGNRMTIGRIAEFFARFGRLNHRMHNKTVLADGRFAIIGGRNVGDRYFGVYDEFVQNDLDIMAVGPIVDDVAGSFDLFWNGSDSYPLDAVAPRRSARGDLDGIAEVIEAGYRDERSRLRAFPFEPVQWREHFESLTASFAAGVGRYEYDLPIVRDGQPDQLYSEFRQFISRARDKIIISSPYFIPDAEFADDLIALKARGVRIVVLTNSLSSNNHIIAHVGYKRWRKRLVRTGIELYESRADSGAIDFYTSPPTEPGFLGLHSKAAVVDDRWSFVGSPNVDPRSMILNTENAFFVDSHELAERVTGLIERDIEPGNAWRVTLNEKGSLEWTSDRGTVKWQPALSFVQRIIEFFITFMPIKDQA
jgi:putative cardiolipin synthase